MPKTQTSTQKFTEIDKIDHDVIAFINGNACLVVEVYPTNFSLLSKEEQDAKIFSYASFLNSLTFPIQILINNRRVDISSYISLLASEIKNAKTELNINYMKQYKDFVEDLVKENAILDKRFYIVIPYSYLETGAFKTISQVGQTQSSSDRMPGIKASLHSKAEGLLSQLGRIGLQTRVVEDEELVDLFHQMYNEEVESESTSAISVMPKAPEEKKV